MSTESVAIVDVRKKGLPDLILVLESEDERDGLRVYAIGFEGGCTVFQLLFNFDHNDTYGIGFVVSGTKLLAVGGQWEKSPKDVKLWDLHDWRHRTEFQMEKGQTLGEKPFPVVFEFEDCIYALAGTLCPANHKMDPVFEVLDLNSGPGWKRLPNPPFLEEYSKDVSPFIKHHSVIDETLYVGLFDDNQRTWKYYSFYIPKKKWATLYSSKVEPVVKNFINYCKIRFISCVDENKMVFTCRRSMEVYACDLNSEVGEQSSPLPPLKEFKMADYRSDKYDASTVSDENMSTNSDDLDECDYDSDDYFPTESVLPRAYLPVDGFQAIRKTLPKRFSNSQMVAHLSGDTYCLVYFYLPSRDQEAQKIEVVTFDVPSQPGRKHRLTANIIDSKHFTIDLPMQILACCKFKFRV